MFFTFTLVISNNFISRERHITHKCSLNTQTRQHLLQHTMSTSSHTFDFVETSQSVNNLLVLVSFILCLYRVSFYALIRY